MITQPFVENSIEHGQLNIIENGNISINFSEKDGMLYIEIIDNGVGRTESGKKNNSMNKHKSMALDITNRRVEIINKKYKSKANISIGDLTDQKYAGTRVQIFLPLLNENLNFDSE
jgi:LytS/YehU family sensor histidine kinase